MLPLDEKHTLSYLKASMETMLLLKFSFFAVLYKLLLDGNRLNKKQFLFCEVITRMNYFLPVLPSKTKINVMLN